MRTLTAVFLMLLLATSACRKKTVTTCDLEKTEAAWKYCVDHIPAGDGNGYSYNVGRCKDHAQELHCTRKEVK